ncbi:cathepsin W [Gracilinanus agilis]|uniref:cathepsin W n=1 Tax=Gracilinanus agilis TaxID=191870 RepID=UPI001CFDDA58|nr:cathepsin W [Gracilinanus agilis]
MGSRRVGHNGMKFYTFHLWKCLFTQIRLHTDCRMLSTKLSCLLGLLAMGGLAWNMHPTLEQSFEDLPPVTQDLMDQFKAFQIQYNKSYPDPAERERRFEIFADNLAWAQWLTEKHGGMAQFGVTQFSDLTEEEFHQLYQPAQSSGKEPSLKTGEPPGLQRPLIRSCDWRKAGVLTPVRKQEKCCSCWAIAAVGNVEALWAIHYQQHFELSVQEVLDCVRCGKGCEGGYIWDAFMTILQQGGLARERDYPYQDQLSPEGCQKNQNRTVWIQDFLILPKEENAMAQYLAQKGPITVTINKALLKAYKKGVIKPQFNCDPNHVDHCVLLVGFSQSPKEGAYWILKNSWGSDWGEEGYFRLQRGMNACGITKYPVTALVGREDGPGPSCPR